MSLAVRNQFLTISSSSAENSGRYGLFILQSVFQLMQQGPFFSLTYSASRFHALDPFLNLIKSARSARRAPIPSRSGFRVQMRCFRFSNPEGVHQDISLPNGGQKRNHRPVGTWNQTGYIYRLQGSESCLFGLELSRQVTTGIGHTTPLVLP